MQLRQQGGWCRDFGSAFYAELLEAAADDAESAGPIWRLLSEKQLPAFPLRLMGAIHRLVLEGAAPKLAAHYPSVGGDGDAAAAAACFVEAIDEHSSRLEPLLDQPVQTNEVSRSVVLLGGFLLVAEEARQPLRLLELGASGGLNLRWDRYRYEIGGQSWGNPASGVQLTAPFDGAPSLDQMVTITERSGCDIEPIDPTTDDGALTLLSYIWADRPDRVERARAAIEIARDVPAAVDRSDALGWVRHRVASLPTDQVTVIFHSIVMPYLDQGASDALRSLLQDAAADGRAILAWLRYEPGPDDTELRLTVWPGGVERLLAHGGPHAQWVRWGDS